MGSTLRGLLPLDYPLDYYYSLVDYPLVQYALLRAGAARVGGAGAAGGGAPSRRAAGLDGAVAACAARRDRARAAQEDEHEQL